ncbi:MAG TPA: antibiotic biosynthesis monooxygenase [Stellaceae bacterium]|nr:antibiotic biosynthesis monooxygenase [Stellaceae bacterium]
MIFGRFQPKERREAEVEAGLREMQAATRAEPGCLELHLYRSVTNTRL